MCPWVRFDPNVGFEDVLYTFGVKQSGELAGMSSGLFGSTSGSGCAMCIQSASVGGLIENVSIS